LYVGTESGKIPERDSKEKCMGEWPFLETSSRGSTNDNVGEIYSSANSEASLRQSLQTCLNSSGASQLHMTAAIERQRLRIS